MHKLCMNQESYINFVIAWIVLTFSAGKGIGFHRQAKLFELNFVVRKTFPYMVACTY